MSQVAAKRFEEQPTLVVKSAIAEKEIPSFLGEAFSMVAELVGRSDGDFAGPPFARYRALDPGFSRFEVEAGFPVDHPLDGGGEVVASTLPAGEAAVTIHVGPYDAMKPAYDATLNWITSQGGEPIGAPWEVYLSDPEAEHDPASWRTEIVQPFRTGS